MIGIAIHLALCSLRWKSNAQAQTCEEVTYGDDGDKVGQRRQKRKLSYKNELLLTV